MSLLLTVSNRYRNIIQIRDSENKTRHENRWLFTLQEKAQNATFNSYEGCVIGPFSAK